MSERVLKSVEEMTDEEMEMGINYLISEQMTRITIPGSELHRYHQAVKLSLERVFTERNMWRKVGLDRSNGSGVD